MRHASAMKYVQVVAPQTAMASAAVTARIDTLGHDYATIMVNFTSEITTDAEAVTVSLLTDDTTTVSNFATITADVTHALVAASSVIYHVDMRGQQRYLRLVVTPGTVVTDDGLIFTCGALLSRSEEAPASTSDMVSTTNDTVTVV